MTARLQTLIGGRWRDGSGPLYSTEYPADGSVVAELHAASVADADEAVQAAEAARHRPSWAGLKPHQRALLLHRMAAGIRERAEELAQLVGLRANVRWQCLLVSASTAAGPGSRPCDAGSPTVGIAAGDHESGIGAPGP